MDDDVKLYCGDCLDVLRTLPDASVDAVVTDPPYMLGHAASRRSADKPMGWTEINNAAHWYRAWMSEAWRVCKDAAPIWICANVKSLPVLSCAAASIGGMSHISTLVWDKDWPSVGSMRGLRQNYELVLLFAKPDFAIADRSVPDIWKVKWGGHKPTGHPAEKPVALIRKTLEVSNVAGGATVLDPFAGSGTVPVACVEHGCKFVGSELDENWHAYAVDRVAAVTRQAAALPLFDCHAQPGLFDAG